MREDELLEEEELEVITLPSGEVWALWPFASADAILA
tara:strand:- start:252 stop:362 length:111 start_codon:yes stop_codon:yes gene_type:complete